MSKNKKMANFGLYLALFGTLTAAVGGFIYNKYSGKSRSDNHSEIIKKQEEIGGKIDSNKKDIIDVLDKKLKTPEKLDDSSPKKKKKENLLPKEDEKKVEYPKNQIVNNAPNQGTQVVGDNTTINIIRNQRVVDDYLKLYLPIEIDKRFVKYSLDKSSLLSITAPMDNESINFGHQIRDFLKSKGYNVWENLNSYMGNMGLGKLDIGFKYDSSHKRLELIVNTQSK